MECFIGQAFCATKKMLCTFQGKLALIPHKYGVKKENIIWLYSIDMNRFIQETFAVANLRNSKILV